MAKDLENMSHAELQAFVEKAQQRMVQLQRSRRSEIRNKVNNLLKAEGFTFDELYGSGGGKRASTESAVKTKIAVKPKYRDPADASQTWTGRGKRPRWFQAALTAGKKETDLLIG